LSLTRNFQKFFTLPDFEIVFLFQFRKCLRESAGCFWNPKKCFLLLLNSSFLPTNTHTHKTKSHTTCRVFYLLSLLSFSPTDLTTFPNPKAHLLDSVSNSSVKCLLSLTILNHFRDHNCWLGVWSNPSLTILY
jgi:hypothetical protein